MKLHTIEDYVKDLQALKKRFESNLNLIREDFIKFFSADENIKITHIQFGITDKNYSFDLIGSFNIKTDDDNFSFTLSFSPVGFVKIDYFVSDKFISGGRRPAIQFSAIRSNWPTEVFKLLEPHMIVRTDQYIVYNKNIPEILDSIKKITQLKYA